MFANLCHWIWPRFQAHLLEAIGRDVVRDGGQRAKHLCHSGLREQRGTLRTFVGFCPSATMTTIAARRGHARGWDRCREVS